MATLTIATLISQAHEGRAEYSLPQLFSIFAMSDSISTLERISQIHTELERWNLNLKPPLTQGEIGSIRRVCFPEAPRFDEETVLTEISLGESFQQEFKSSLLYNYQRAAREPHASIKDLTASSLLTSTLKSIAAFLNTDGGILYLGVGDQGNILGVEQDFPCISENTAKQNIDHWELHLRNCIESGFIEGKTINDYVVCRHISVCGRAVVRIQVSPRKKISFYLSEKITYLYRRQGNKTDAVLLHEVEEFLSSRGWKAPE